MQVFRGLPAWTDPPWRGCAVTWGVFDGVHRGHQKVLDALVAWARELAVPPVVLTFDRHPAEVLWNSAVPLVVPLEQRIELIGARHVEAVVILPFTVEFSRTTAEEFIRDIVRDRMGACAVLLGHDSHFGHDRAGDVAMLERSAGDLGIAVRTCAPELHRGRPLSSSLVREAVLAGRLDEAWEILGRPFALFGTVVRGDGRGASIGVPTANVAVLYGLKPPRGVYAVEASLGEGVPCLGAANVGCRPTFHPEGAAESVEVHLIDYAGPSLLGRRLEVRFLERVREERKFSGPAELAAQIRRDIEWIRSRARENAWSSVS
ncbi:MAG: riboflavin biosynthesis protein RibF [Planctomycetes bacterium]|nr:riboflavin biosynthesis protein RibF [Planctomycetota bacterium]